MFTRYFQFAMMIALMLVGAVTLSACGTKDQANVVAGLSTIPGQLFCQLDSLNGPTVVGLIDAKASASLGSGAPVAILATNAAAATVQAECAQAAANVGAKAGVPVSPPTTTVGTVAVTPVS